MSIYRIWFMTLYGLGLVLFLTSLFRFRRLNPTVTRQTGPFPPPPAVINWLVALAILGSRVGQIHQSWPPVRAVGLLLSVYAVIMTAGAVRAVGRNFVPGAGILEGHGLVVTGVYRWVRHPLYSAVVALWLGAALGALDWLMLAVWPLALFGLLRQVKAEEDLLRQEFGPDYEAYAARVGAVVPGIR